MLFLNDLMGIYNVSMTHKRPFLSCHKCGSNCIGKFRDEANNPLCSGCNPTGKSIPMYPCTKCGNGHHNTLGDGLCIRCRTTKSSDMRVCPTCGGRIVSKIEAMNECMKCMGKPKYWRLLRASKK